MARGFDAAKFNREMRAAQRKAEAALKRDIDRANRENQRQVDAYNRKVDAHNKKVVADHNREVDRANRENQRRVDAHNRKADAHNRAVIADINRQLRTASSGPRYTVGEQERADRIQHAIADAMTANGTCF